MKKLAAQMIPLFFCGLFASSIEAQNLLSNPDFKKVDPQGVPVSWAREYNPQLSGPFKVAKDARDGKATVVLMTEEWTLDRPQFIFQDVKLSAGAKALRLSARCKGQGQVRLALQFRKNGKPLKVEAIKEYFGEYAAPEEMEKVFGLSCEYWEHALRGDIPSGADEVRVRIGNTIGKLNTSNVWGALWINQVSLVAEDGASPVAAEAPIEPVDTLEAPKNCVDVAPLALAFTDPPSRNTRSLADGETEGPGATAPYAAFIAGTERYPAFVFQFSEPVPVTVIQLHVPGKEQKVRQLLVRGDPDGSGRFQSILGCVILDSSRGGWIKAPIEKAAVRAIRIEALEGEGLVGYRQVLPYLDEVRIFAPAAEVEPRLAALRNAAPFARGSLPPEGVPEASFRPRDFPLPPVPEKRFGKIMIASLWMFGIPAGKDLAVTDYSQSPAFRRVMDLSRQTGFDTFEIFLEENNVRGDCAPWPSKVAGGSKENILKAAIDALHAEKFPVYVTAMPDYSPPFEKSIYLFPKEESSRYPQTTQRPSIVHGTYCRDNWLALLDEILACGADGVSICSDEHYYKGHFMETFPKNDPGRAIYRQRFGHDLPEREEDTLAFRQWIGLRHEGVTDLYRYWATELRKRHPRARFMARFMAPDSSCSFVTETGIPMDTIGERAEIDDLGSDYLGPYGIRMMSAANGWRRGLMCFDATMLGPRMNLPRRTDLECYGEVLWSIMYGLGKLAVYRYNYVAENGAQGAWARGLSTMSDLERLGVWDARPPRKIALLTSRASLDWWQIRAWWGKHDDPRWDRGAEGSRGWFAERVGFDLLQQNGYPFEWLFLDRPDQLKDLDQYKVLLIPFAWAMSREAAERVRAAAEKGARVILLDGKAGCADEWGEPYPVPVLQSLVDSGKAILVPDDILKWGPTDTYAAKVLAAVDQGLGNAWPLSFRRYGKRIEAMLLEKSPEEVFLFVLNWERKLLSPVDLRLPLPEGNWEVFARDENGWNEMRIDGKTWLSAAQLRNFRLNLPPEKTYVLYIRKAK